MKNLIFVLMAFFSLTALAQLEVENVYNTPGFSGRSTTTIEDKLISLTKLAVPGSTIRAALYNFSRVPIVQALVEASKRGVDVKLVLDGGNLVNINEVGHAIHILTENLQCREGQECVHFCSGPLEGPIKLLKIKKNYPLGGSCRGLVINHNKLFLFSELSNGDKNVIAQTSANMTDSQLKLYNDLMIIKNNLGLFLGFTEYWEKLKADHSVLLKKSFPTLHAENATVYFFPRLVSADPVLELLKRVNCKIPGSRIRASQAAFTRSKVAEEMKRLADEGCELDVIARVDSGQSSPSSKVKDALGSHLTLLPYDGKTPAEKNENSIHTKIVLIDASIDNSPEKVPVVLTGSHNLDLFSLKGNDETLIEIRDQQVYDRYSAFLDQILSDAREAGIQLF